MITKASLNLTRNCNLKCSYCFTRGCREGSMTPEIGRKVIDFLFKNARSVGDKSIDIGFWGGEPLLEWELLQELVLYAESKRICDCGTKTGVTFGGTTNGTLLTPEKLDFLGQHKVFFMISLDGTEETHNKYRGQHSVIMQNMREVMRRFPFTKVRMSPYAERIGHFYEDVKFLVDHGMTSIMFSPVYETFLEEEPWQIWEDQCLKVVDLIILRRTFGQQINIEHFNSYQGVDNSCWPCGAGRFYVGFDIDGSIYPCHRFNKFNDNRPWQEKELCIGHVDVGITRPEFRDKFINWVPQNCQLKECYLETPCHGGCYGVNYDLTGSMNTPAPVLCRYVQMQKKVSSYFKKRLETVKPQPNQGKGCICNFEFYTGPV